MNSWVINSREWSWGSGDWESQFQDLSFNGESSIPLPAQTPVLSDSIWFRGFPLATHLPTKDLAIGGNLVRLLGMELLSIPRHGNRPTRIPRNWPTSSPLPGAINVAFFDGHVEQVQLERLWQLYWHKDYEPPAKRPGLP